MRAKRERGREDAIGRAQRKQAVAVDRFDAHVEAAGGRGDHPRQEEHRRVVGDHGGGIRGERLEQPAALAGPGLDVGEVARRRAREGPGVVGHALQHEGVQAIARPGIADTQRLEDDERPRQLHCQLDRAFQGEVGARPARRDHPVEDVGPLGTDRRVVGAADPHRRHRSSVRAGGRHCPRPRHRIRTRSRDGVRASSGILGRLAPPRCGTPFELGGDRSRRVNGVR